ncbi:outer membrane beta-barrel protein [Massilia violaceinigra]|uniref:Outer membrane beta-barrel protein n=1 Tax=Massilia violaceinigra TaxID=2045208 RepID=A0ABY4ADU8_9BURK|nr:porin family protein [Massilia violaceinigra]UOD32975.1 outer membrane beta-barrel protein [Massilia violaceinigra]
MFKKIAFAAALTVMASSSFAAEANKFYVGGDFGTTKVDDYSDRETGYGAFVGYNITPTIAVEAGYRRLASFDEYNTDVTFDQAAISVIGSVPLSSGFGLFGRLGYNRLEAKASAGGFSATESTNKALYGFGATYAFTPAISGRIEVQRPSSDLTNFSAGVSFQF